MSDEPVVCDNCNPSPNVCVGFCEKCQAVPPPDFLDCVLDISMTRPAVNALVLEQRKEAYAEGRREGLQELVDLLAERKHEAEDEQWEGLDSAHLLARALLDAKPEDSTDGD